jgi:hypothetical protein
MVKGCAINDSTPPKPEASLKRRVPSATRLALGDRVPRVIWQAGVVHALDARMLTQEARDGERI